MQFYLSILLVRFLSETTLALLRHPEYCISGYSSVSKISYLQENILEEHIIFEISMLMCIRFLEVISAQVPYCQQHFFSPDGLPVLCMSFNASGLYF